MSRSVQAMVMALLFAGCATCVRPSTNALGGSAANVGGTAAAVAGGLAGGGPIGLGAELLWTIGSELACRAARLTTPPSAPPPPAEPAP